jgi:hypothetical protein
MHPTQFLGMFVIAGFVIASAFVFHNFLKSAQCREDDEDERLWHYLPDPRSVQR